MGTPASWREGDAELAAAATELEALYAALPLLACKGLCQHSCSEHVDASDLEHARARDAGVDLTAPTATGACPALASTFGAGHCAIHSVRPMVCRLWDIAASMPCPHGCLPDLTAVNPAEDPAEDPAENPGEGSAPTASRRHLSDTTALRSMMAVLRLGGHESAAPGVAELLEACAGDEAAAGLMSRLMRGDTTAKPALAQRLQQLRAQPHTPQPALGSTPRAPASTSAARTAAGRDVTAMSTTAVVAPVTTNTAPSDAVGERP